MKILFENTCEIIKLNFILFILQFNFNLNFFNKSNVLKYQC